MDARKAWLLVPGLLLATAVSTNAQMIRRVRVRAEARYGFSQQASTGVTPASHLAGPAAIQSFSGHHAAVRSVAYTPDGKFLVTAGFDNNIRVWGLASGVELRCLQGHTAPIISVAVCPDGRHVISGSLDKTVRLWDLDTGKEIRSFRGHTKDVHHVAVSPDGRWVASASYDGTSRLWNLATGKEAHRLPGKRGSVLVVAFSPDSTILASGGEDHLITLWQVQTGKQLRQLKGDTDSILGLAFSPDGSLLASASHDKTVRLWQVATGKEIRQFGQSRTQQSGYTLDKRVRDVAFSPDGKTLASVGMDNIVHLWEVATGRECVEYSGSGSTIWAVAFAPDGHSLATASEDQQARVWDATCRGGLVPTKLSAAQLTNLWNDLADQDPGPAYRAIWTLAAMPQLSVPFLQKHLQTSSRSVIDPADIARLIGRLDDDSSIVREQATDDLAHLGKAAEPALRKAISSTHSAEVDLRARMLLAHVRGVVWAPDALQRLRAIRVLEQIGTPTAQKVLHTLANGGRQDHVGTEARAALERLTKRTS